MTGTVAERLRMLGIALPPPPQPAANYAAYVRNGNLVQVAAVASARSDGSFIMGKVGSELSLDEGYEAAKACALHLLAVLDQACAGNLDCVRQLFKVRGFVNATDSFEPIPRVIDGASDLFVSVFGPEIGRHARTSIGCATLPGRVAVEVDLLAICDLGPSGENDDADKRRA